MYIVTRELMLLVMSVCSGIGFEKPNFKNMMPTYIWYKTFKNSEPTLIIPLVSNTLPFGSTLIIAGPPFRCKPY